MSEGNVLNKGELLLAQGMLINQTSLSENISSEIIHSIDWGTSASKLKAAK
jgi:hypothetical protein